MSKRVRIEIEADVPDDVDQEALAERFGNFLEKAGLPVSFEKDRDPKPHLAIRTVGPRFGSVAEAGGYDTRMWDRESSCDFREFDPDRIDDILVNPYINIRILDRDIGSGGA